MESSTRCRFYRHARQQELHGLGSQISQGMRDQAPYSWEYSAWRCFWKYTGAIRNVELLLRKVASSWQSQPKTGQLQRTSSMCFCKSCIDSPLVFESLVYFPLSWVFFVICLFCFYVSYQSQIIFFGIFYFLNIIQWRGCILLYCVFWGPHQNYLSIMTRFCFWLFSLVYAF